MIEIFIIKNVTTLNNLARLLIIPLLSAAVYADFGFWVIEEDAILSWLFSLDLIWAVTASKVIAFIVGVFIVAMVFKTTNTFLASFSASYFFVGLSLLTIGLMPMIQQDEQVFNAYWHLGFLCWGLSIFEANNTSSRTG